MKSENGKEWTMMRLLMIFGMVIAVTSIVVAVIESKILVANINQGSKCEKAQKEPGQSKPEGKTTYR